MLQYVPRYAYSATGLAPIVFDAAARKYTGCVFVRLLIMTVNVEVAAE